MQQQFKLSIQVSAENEQNAAEIAAVLSNFVKTIPENKILEIAKKIKKNPQVLKKVIPYISIL